MVGVWEALLVSFLYPVDDLPADPCTCKLPWPSPRSGIYQQPVQVRDHNGQCHKFVSKSSCSASKDAICCPASGRGGRRLRRLPKYAVESQGRHRIRLGEVILDPGIGLPQVITVMLLWREAVLPTEQADLRLTGKLHKVQPGSSCFLPWVC
jgi:hypothetical protein